MAKETTCPNPVNFINAIQAMTNPLLLGWNTRANKYVWLELGYSVSALFESASQLHHPILLPELHVLSTQIIMGSIKIATDSYHKIENYTMLYANTLLLK